MIKWLAIGWAIWIAAIFVILLDGHWLIVLGTPPFMGLGIATGIEIERRWLTRRSRAAK